MAWISPLLLLFLLVLLLAASLRILREYQRGVVFQLGRFWKVKGPGLVRWCGSSFAPSCSTCRART
jgi:regulator of protease activity HflC (stomatin/prohibitin superfamily)